MYIVIRNKYKFIISSLDTKKCFLDSKYQECIYISGECKELGLKTTIVIPKTKEKRIKN